MAPPSTANLPRPRSTARRWEDRGARSITRKGEGQRWPRRSPSRSSGGRRRRRHYERYPLRRRRRRPRRCRSRSASAGTRTSTARSRRAAGTGSGSTQEAGKVRGGHCVCLEPGDQLDGNGKTRGCCRTARAGGTRRPGPRGRLRRLRLLADDEPARPQALRRALAVGLGQVDRRVAGDQSGRRRGHERARGVRHPAQPRPRAVEGRVLEEQLQAARQGAAGRQGGHHGLSLGEDGRPGRRRAQEPGNDRAGAVRILNSWGRGTRTG